MIYSTILYKAWLFFPGSEGLITGIIIAGFGIGGFIFTELSTHYVNPDHIASIKVNENDASSKFFPMSIA